MEEEYTEVKAKDFVAGLKHAADGEIRWFFFDSGFCQRFGRVC